MTKSGGRRVRPPLPGEAPLRSARNAAPGYARMRGVHRGAAPTGIAPGSRPSHHYYRHDFYYLRFLQIQLPLASFNPVCPHLHPLGHSPGWENLFPPVGYSMPKSRFPPCPSPPSPQPPSSLPGSRGRVPQPPPAPRSLLPLLLPRGGGNNFQPLQPLIISFQQQLRILAQNLKKYPKIRQRCYLLPCN